MNLTILVVNPFEEVKVLRRIPFDVSSHIRHDVGFEFLVGSPVDIPWLDAPHDGYPLCPTLASYVRARRASFTSPSLMDDAALCLSAMTFGFLEAVMGIKIPESSLLSKHPGSQETVISRTELSKLFLWWSSSAGEKPFLLQPGPKIAELFRREFLAIKEELSEPTGGILLRAGIDLFTSYDILFPVYTMMLALASADVRQQYVRRD